MLKFFIVCLFSFSLYSCGLDVVVYLEPPTITHNNYDSEDDSRKYLEFETAESKNGSVQDYVKGYEIYYKIYGNRKDRASDYASIYSYNEDNPGVSVTYLLESKKYKILSSSVATSNDRPLIKNSSANRTIRLRFIKYDNEEAGLYINNVKVGLPIRSNGLEFNKNDISTLHEDVLSRNGSEDEYWYVNMYAATYGSDQAFKPLYSKLEFIGFLKIKKY